MEICLFTTIHDFKLQVVWKILLTFASQSSLDVKFYFEYCITCTYSNLHPFVISLPMIDFWFIKYMLFVCLFFIYWYLPLTNKQLLDFKFCPCMMCKHSANLEPIWQFNQILQSTFLYSYNICAIFLPKIHAFNPFLHFCI